MLCSPFLNSCNGLARPEQLFRSHILVHPCLALAPPSFPYLSLSIQCLVCSFPLSFCGTGSSRKLWSKLSSGTKSSTLCTFVGASGREGGVAAASVLATVVIKHWVHHKQDRNLIFTYLSCPGPLQHTDNSHKAGPQLCSNRRGKLWTGYRNQSRISHEVIHRPRAATVVYKAQGWSSLLDESENLFRMVADSAVQWIPQLTIPQPDFCTYTVCITPVLCPFIILSPFPDCSVHSFSSSCFLNCICQRQDCSYCAFKCPMLPKALELLQIKIKLLQIKICFNTNYV